MIEKRDTIQCVTILNLVQKEWMKVKSNSRIELEKKTELIEESKHHSTNPFLNQMNCTFRQCQPEQLIGEHKMWHVLPPFHYFRSGTLSQVPRLDSSFSMANV
jgi:hypothetical protein